MEYNPPVIGISGASSDSASVRAMMTQIRSAGAVPMLLSNHAARIARSGGSAVVAAREDLEKIDALIVMGNDGDINPARYGAEVHTATNIEKDAAREEYEFSALAQAISQRMPVLGICGGMQRINVLAGGTLHQHIPDLLGNETLHAQQDAGIPPMCPVEAVELREGTLLSTISHGIKAVYTPSHEKLPEGTVMENSLHHQAVNLIGKGLRMAAASPDGIAEAIEPEPTGPLANQFLLGVQWHPEFGASELGPRIAAAVSTAAGMYAQAGYRNHPMHEAVEETIFSSAPAMQAKFHKVHPAPKPHTLTGHVAKVLASLQPQPQGATLGA